MLKIHVKMFGGVRRYIEGGEGIVSLPEGATLTDLLQQVGIGGAEAGAVLVNDKMAKSDTELKEGDQVKIYGTMAGG